MSKKQKEEKRGPSGMTKRTKFIKPDPPPLPPSPGDIVWYPDKKGAWRTGQFIRVVDRGKDWGKCIVRDSVTGGKKYVLSENVRAIEGGSHE